MSCATRNATRSTATRGPVTALALGIGLGLLAACAGPTGYQAASAWNNQHGWRDQLVGPDEYAIVVRGSPETSMDRAARIALLRAAHLTVEQGHERFTILADASARRSQDASSSVPIRSGGTTFFVPVDIQITSEPVAVLLIRVLPARAPSGDDDVDARQVIASLQTGLE